MNGVIIPVEQVTPGQAAQVAALHERELPSLLAWLGKPVLERFYRGFARRDDSFGFMLLNNGEVRGWVVGAGDPGRAFRRAIHPIPAFVLHLVRMFIRHPGLPVQLVSSLARPRPNALYPRGSAELLFIAVHPGERGKGSAGRLLSAFLEEARSRRFTGVALSVEIENRSAVQFYRKAGFIEIGELTEGKYHRKRLYRAFTTA